MIPNRAKYHIGVFIDSLTIKVTCKLLFNCISVMRPVGIEYPVLLSLSCW